MLDLTQERLKEVLHYDDESGIFTWLSCTSGRVKASEVAGSLNTNGYIVIKINSVQHKAHRLAYLYCVGIWPSGQIDHIDGNRTNNSIMNLREITGYENSRNSKINSNNTSGVKGVSWHKVKCRWEVRIRVDGINIHLGFYNTVEEATKVIREARELHHKEFANHG